MSNFELFSSRRLFLGQMAVGASAFVMPTTFAEELLRTPQQTEGPFFPDRLPLDTDNDLIVINESLESSIGQITHLTGRVLDIKGNPVRNAVVEIWQVDNKGSYLHSRGDGGQGRDRNFQGFGRFMTGLKGEFYFRTIKPVAYPGRTPHIHLAVKQKGQRKFTTQLYIEGEKQNEKDFLYQRVKNPKARQSITLGFIPIKDSKIGELTAHCDIVLGLSPRA